MNCEDFRALATTDLDDLFEVTAMMMSMLY